MERRRCNTDITLLVAVRLKTGETLDPDRVQRLSVTCWHLFYREIRMAVPFDVVDGVIRCHLPASWTGKPGKYAVTVEYEADGRHVADECPALEAAG